MSTGGVLAVLTRWVRSAAGSVGLAHLVGVSARMRIRGLAAVRSGSGAASVRPCGSPVGLGGDPSGPTAVRQVLRQASQALGWTSSGLCGAAAGWRDVPVEPVEPVVGSLNSLSSLDPWARQARSVRRGHIVRGEEAADDRCRRAASGDPRVGVGHSSASPFRIAINYENVIRCESVRWCSGHPRHDQPGPSWPCTIASCHAASGADPGQRRSPQRADADSTANDGRPDSI